MHRKTILAGVSAFALLLGGATAALADSATAKVEQTVGGGTAVDVGSLRDNSIDNSEIGSSGIANWQQNNGSNNAMGISNAVQAGIDSDNDLTANAEVRQSTTNTRTVAAGGSNQERTNDINTSFNNFKGVSNTQQNNGDHNVIGVANAVHTRIDKIASTSDEGNVDQTVVVNQSTGGHSVLRDGGVLDNDQTRTNTVTDSYGNASGINNAQQNNGTGNALGIANSVAVDVGGADGDDNVTQTVNVVGSVLRGQSTFDKLSDRSNSISGSFNDSDGIANVQQNNGDSNVLGIANAVMANLGLGEEPEELNNDANQEVNVTGNLQNVAAFDVDQPIGDDADSADINGDRSNTINPSFNNASGIANVQQNNGSNNIMGIGNAVQANIDIEPVGNLNGDDKATQVANTAGGSIGNVTQSHGFALNPPAANRRNTIDDSFDGFTGIANVQQNNGDNNIVVASTAVAASIRSADKFDDVESAVADTEGSVTNASADDQIPGRPLTDGTNRANSISSSFEGAQGILGVQQNNGSNNVMGIANTVVANVDTSQDNSAESASNTARTDATVSDNRAVADRYVDRANTVSNSFNNASGIANVQQNNGANNVMGISNSVSADLNNDLAAGWGPGVTSLATVTATVAGNTSQVAPTAGPGGGYLNTASSAFNGFAGISTVQQNNGANNAIQASTAVTANINPFPVGGNFLGGLNQ